MSPRPRDAKAQNPKTSFFALIATTSLLLFSAPTLTPAQAQPQSQTPPGFGNFMRPGERGAGWLGVSISDVTADKAKELKLPEAEGVVVNEVGQNSPAAKAGLQQGDVITDYEGQRVQGALQFERLVRETPPGRTAKLSVWRDGKTQSISAVIGDASSQAAGPQDLYHWRVQPNGPEGFFTPQMPGPNAPQFPNFPPGFQEREQAPSLGISALDLSGQLGAYFGAPDGEGVLVTDVHAGSPGEKAGLKAGDVITKLDGKRIRNIGELRAQLRARRDASTVTLTIIRKGSEISVTATPEKPQSRRSGNGESLIPL